MGQEKYCGSEAALATLPSVARGFCPRALNQTFEPNLSIVTLQP